VFVLPSGLEVSSSVASDEAKEQGEKDCADDRYYDGVDKAARASVTELLHDEAAYDGSNDAYDDVSDCAVSATLHEFAGKETSNEANDDPPDNKHLVLS